MLSLFVTIRIKQESECAKRITCTSSLVMKFPNRTFPTANPFLSYYEGKHNQVFDSYYFYYYLFLLYYSTLRLMQYILCSQSVRHFVIYLSRFHYLLLLVVVSTFSNMLSDPYYQSAHHIHPQWRNTTSLVRRPTRRELSFLQTVVCLSYSCLFLLFFL